MLSIGRHGEDILDVRPHASKRSQVPILGAGVSTIVRSGKWYWWRIPVTSPAILSMIAERWGAGRDIRCEENPPCNLSTLIAQCGGTHP